MPMTSSNAVDPKEGDAIVNENPADKASKQPIFQVINTMDESSTDIPSAPGKIFLLFGCVYALTGSLV